METPSRGVCFKHAQKTPPHGAQCDCTALPQRLHSVASVCTARTSAFCIFKCCGDAVITPLWCDMGFRLNLYMLRRKPLSAPDFQRACISCSRCRIYPTCCALMTHHIASIYLVCFAQGLTILVPHMYIKAANVLFYSSTHHVLASIKPRLLFSRAGYAS